VQLAIDKIFSDDSVSTQLVSVISEFDSDSVTYYDVPASWFTV